MEPFVRKHQKKIIEIMPDFFSQVSKGRPAFGAGRKGMPVRLLLFHGPGILSDTRKAADMVSHADTDLGKWSRLA
jgi:hypothetical protein